MRCSLFGISLVLIPKEFLDQIQYGMVPDRFKSSGLPEKLKAGDQIHVSFWSSGGPLGSLEFTITQ
jgi:hypothetical protein